MIPVFVGGTGRSGTTILKRVFAFHPTIASIPVELRVIIDPRGALDLKLALTQRWSPYSADFAIQSFRRLMLECESTNILRKSEIKLFSYLGIAPLRYASVGLGQAFGQIYYRERLEKLINDLAFHVSKGSWDGTPSYQMPARIYEADRKSSEEVIKLIREFIGDLFQHRYPDKTMTHWIDDTPYNLLHVEELFELFPDLKFIHIYRDPRDVMVSHRRFRWGGDDWIAIARRLSNTLKRWFEIRDRLPASVYREVCLEELASSPSEIVDEICDFIGVDFCVELESGLRQIKPELAHAGRWKNEVSSDEWETTSPYLLPYVKAYGYVV